MSSFFLRLICSYRRVNDASSKCADCHKRSTPCWINLIYRVILDIQVLH